MILPLLAYVYARRGVRAAWAAGPNAHSATYFPATNVTLSGKGLWCGARPFPSRLATEGQLIVRTRHRVGGNRTRTFAVATKGLTRFNPVLSYDLFLEAEG